jgi:hypothetical protein
MAVRHMRQYLFWFRQRILLIAADSAGCGAVLAVDAILVSNKVREFGRVNGLRVENWMRS